MGTSAVSSRGKKILLAVALALLAWVVALLYVFASAPPASPEDADKVQTIEVLYDIPEASPAALAAASDNVFVGRVERLVGQEVVETSSNRPGEEGKPLTKFAVSVSEPIKSAGQEPAREGDTLTVGQYGGELNGKTYRIVGVVGGQERADAPLEPGGEYLFSTSYNPGRGLQEISVQPHGDVPLRGAEPAAKEELAAAFREAVEAQ